MDKIIEQHTVTADFGIKQCRMALRLDINWQGVIKNEVTENHFELKGVAINKGMLGTGLSQYVTIILTEQTETSTVVHIQTAPYAQVNNNEAEWRSQMQQLIGILWTEICRALENMYGSGFSANATVAENNNSRVDNIQAPANAAQPTAFGGNVQAPASAARPITFYAKHKKAVWIGIGIIALIIIVLYMMKPQSFGGGITGTYVGTEAGQDLLGRDGTWETTVILKGDMSYSIKVINLNHGTTTYSSTGTYRTSGADSNTNVTIIFSDSSGSSFNAQMQANISGRPFLSFVYSSNDEVASACYKK